MGTLQNGVGFGNYVKTPLGSWVTLTKWNKSQPGGPLLLSELCPSVEATCVSWDEKAALKIPGGGSLPQHPTELELTPILHQMLSLGLTTYSLWFTIHLCQLWLWRKLIHVLTIWAKYFTEIDYLFLNPFLGCILFPWNYFLWYLMF